MKMLTFSPRCDVVDGRRIRAASFVDRSTLAVSSACVVANSIRDGLGAAFAAPVELRLFEASVPSQRGWEAITRDAMMYAAPGIALILRLKDAQAFARAAFGEFSAPDRALSELENAVLERIISTLGAACAPVVSGPSPRFERAHAMGSYVTYFEIQVERPVCFRVGIALESDPAIQPRATLAIESLLDVQVELSVLSAPTTVLAAAVADLEPGTIVPMTYTKGAAFRLVLAGRPLASGECGVSGDRFALAIEHLHKTEGSYAPSL